MTSATPQFENALRANGLFPFQRSRVTTLQINVGKRCNQACHHCHVDAGPKRTEEMAERTAVRVIELIQKNPAIEIVDITGGAPELNPHFRMLISESRRLGKEVIDRCNLTVFFEPGMEDLPEFLTGQNVKVVASLPCYGPSNVDAQRGQGVFEKSIRALRLLNSLGYGLPGSSLKLDLVYNPLGSSLPPEQLSLEADYRKNLWADFEIQFHRLITITNMPIARFAQDLERTGRLEAYMSLLINHFNPATVSGLMCRSLVSVGYDGRLYDCDFNQMLELKLGSNGAAGPKTIWEIDSFDKFEGHAITTGSHCFGCAAGAGSSCSGAIT